ncbi:uncharacterized protein LOC135837694 [Planococcus citri]|uniref:uncharacterized protein LOC135837694 n=1 Tax=Planococcus citri TaxID=170843 RepID=UPI0031FA13F0
MMETVSDVYDLFYPSPVSLKEISSIVVAADLWRKEICSRLESNKNSHELRLKKNIALEHTTLNLPSAIHNLVERYVHTFRDSIFSWQEYHRCRVFDRSGRMNIWSRFDDFAWDWDGTIHEERTAKRMMMCDRLTKVEKFKIACLYCFEDDIKQIWPSVRKTNELNIKIDFNNRPELYYWICYLRNELHLIPNENNYPIDELMIIKSSALESRWRNRSYVMYFWNRLPSDSQPPRQAYSNHKWLQLFVRFILPKLNEYQLDIFVAKNGCDVIESLLTFESTLAHVLPTWMYIRSRVDLKDFTRFINGLLEEKYFCGAYFHSEKVWNLCSKIWKSAPQHFKRAVLDDVLYNDLLSRIRNTSRLWDNRRMTLLITVLQDATFEERNAFLHKNWLNLIFIAHAKDLDVMMKSSFKNENEITLFKENVMSMYENIAKDCALLLKQGSFEALNHLLSVCCLDERKRKEFKRRLLSSNYVGDNSVLTINLIENNKLLNEFIDDAFQDAADLGIEFRNQLRSSPVTQKCLLECIRKGCFVYLMQFVDSFVLDERIVMSMKKRFLRYFEEQLIADKISSIDSHKLQVFLMWLVGSEDEVIKFKEWIPVKDIFRTMMPYECRIKLNNDPKPKFPQKVDHFLSWYFNNDKEEIDKFTKPFLESRKRKRIV